MPFATARGIGLVMRLESFEILPDGETGWTSGVLPFGRNTTLLLGSNGAGKTPVMRALAHALGQPAQLPQLIKEKCSGTRLTLNEDGRSWSILRSFRHSNVSVVDHDGTLQEIVGDKELAQLLLPKLGLTPRNFAGKNGQVVPPYLSVLGPMFIVDQDSGWGNWYVPNEAHQFLKNQREEVLRWVLALPARNRVVDRDEYETAQVRLGGVQQRVRIMREALSGLEQSLSNDRGTDALDRLRARKGEVDSEFAIAFAAVNDVGRKDDDISSKATTVAETRRALGFKLMNLKRRRVQLAGVQAELGAEIGSLEQNETAAEVFRVFCGNVACQLFRKPEESYGRRMLFIKDQLKDFESNAGEIEREIAVLEQQLRTADNEFRELAEERRRRSVQSGATSALERLQSLSREATTLHARMDAIGRVEETRARLEALLVEEQRASELVNELKPSRGPRKPVGRVLDARALLADTFREWMSELRTPNVSTSVSFDEELRLMLGNELFGSASSHSGSTRTRLVLAFHAAVLETSLKLDGEHPPLLILDAPRQHELSAVDLRSFVEKFCRMARSLDVNSPQLVFSASDPDVVPPECIDRLWKPTFAFGDELRFLGPVSMGAV
jgi:DNA repair exonuclease SbcCD ATPase subunit